MPDEQNGFGEGEPSLREVKGMRREHPSGWLELSMYESRALMVDALLETSPDYEFDHADLSQRAGVTDESVRNHIDIFVEFGLIELVSDEGKRTYRVNDRSKVLYEIENLNSAVNAIRAGGSRTLSDTELRNRTARHTRVPHSFNESWDLEAAVPTSESRSRDLPEFGDIDLWPSPTNRQPPHVDGGH